MAAEPNADCGGDSRMSQFRVSAVRSVEIGTPDLEKAESFYTEVWGLEVVDRQGDAVYLRATGPDHHVLALHPSNQLEIRSVTFRMRLAEDLPALCAAVAANGGRILQPQSASPDPGGGIVATVATPQGHILRFVHGDLLHTISGPRKHLPLRLAHVNLNCDDTEATTRFFEAALGFRMTDRSKAMAFLRCNADHHAVVLADSGVNGLNHVAYLMPDFDSVMCGSGRMIDHGYLIGWGVGRHGPGNNIFAYFLDSAGFVVEYTAEVLQVDDSYKVGGPDDWKWPPGRTDLWGIAPPKSDAVKKAQLAVKFARRE
jgi:catechol 2,3-dioxygenase-like lactoylglutathione lyase family enzyme